MSLPATLDNDRSGDQSDDSIDVYAIEGTSKELEVCLYNLRQYGDSSLAAINAYVTVPLLLFFNLILLHCWAADMWCRLNVRH